MHDKINPKTLQQRWLHSHEEDTDTEMVFRPATFNFPPSRGRTGFDLRPDGSLVQIGIAPTDQQQTTEGTWKLEDGGKLYLYTKSQSQPSRVMQVASIDNNRLIIKK